MSKANDEICAIVRAQFALLLYGELSFDEEERVESHLDTCEECRAALVRERTLHAAFDNLQTEPPSSLLRECREDLYARLQEEEAPGRPHTAWWDRFVDAITLRPASGMLRPAGALALIAVGFLGARFVPSFSFAGGGAYQAMGLAEPQASRVRYVEPAAGGRVQIVLDETRQRVISGQLDDQQIRTLLLEAARDPSDPGLRAETVNILNTRAQSADVRDTLIYALRHDQNAGVRLKAMDGLKPFVQQPEVRSALSEVLLSDMNPGLRTQAIDLLTAANTNVDREIVGTLQELMQRGEQQDYVRERCLRALQAMKASAEIY